MTYVEEVIKKYKELSPSVREKIGNEKAVSFVISLENAYGVELKFPLMLVATKELSLDNLEEYLIRKYGISEEYSIDIKEKLIKNILLPVIESIYKSDGNLMDIEEEKKVLIEVFGGGLIKEVLKGDLVSKRNINIRLIYILSESSVFKKSLENALYNSSELITHQDFFSGGGHQTPTIGNWIQDFIKRNGSENFNNLVLTDYMTNSENAKILSIEEKKLVQKLLLLYRNLKFFPLSMPSDNPDDWEIIPTDRFSDVLDKARQVSGPPKTEEEKDIDGIRAEEEKYAVGGLERLALEEEISKKKKLEELKIIAGKYRDGTLEKNAILEEIKKLER